MQQEVRNGKPIDPRVVIKQQARDEWEITLYEWEEQIFPYNSWFRRSKAAAERKANRELRRYKRTYGNLEKDTVIR